MILENFDQAIAVHGRVAVGDQAGVKAAFDEGDGQATAEVVEALDHAGLDAPLAR